jgi:hypothetical protein
MSRAAKATRRYGPVGAALLIGALGLAACGGGGGATGNFSSGGVTIRVSSAVPLSGAAAQVVEADTAYHLGEFKGANTSATLDEVVQFVSISGDQARLGLQISGAGISGSQSQTDELAKTNGKWVHTGVTDYSGG